MNPELPDSDDSLNRITNEIVEPLNRLRRRLDVFRLRLDFYSADFSLYGFILGAWENAAAACHLAAKSDLAFAATPSARAAFESAQDALLLVTEPDFAMAGARARVFERLELVDLANDVRRAFGNGNGDPRSYDDVAATIERDIQRVEKMAPGTGQYLRDALAYFRPKFEAAAIRKGKHPGHWAELSRRRIAERLGQRLEDSTLADRLIAVYADLSRNTHPRLRLENWDRKKEDKRLGRSERGATRAAASVLLSLQLAHDSATRNGQPEAEA